MDLLAQTDGSPSQQGRTRILMVGLVLCLTFAMVYFLTIRPGQDWGDDFAMYILQARNLVHGGPLVPTEYLYNPSAAVVGPPVYPPGFPALLAPVVAIWGIDLYPMKVEQAFLLAATVLILFWLAVRRASPLVSAIVTIVIAVSPLLWDQRDRILSDIPFLLICSTTLLVLSINEQDDWRSLGRGLLSAVLVYFAFATRTIGIALIPAMGAYVLRTRKLPANLVRSVAVAIGLIALHLLLFRTNGYLNQLTSPLHTLVNNGKIYFFLFGRTLLYLHSPYVEVPFTMSIAALAMAGLFKRFRRPGALEVFFCVYLVCILFWPGDADARLLLPLLLPTALYFIEGLSMLRPPLRFVYTPLLLAPLVIGFGHYHDKLIQRRLYGGIDDPGFLKMCTYMEGLAPKNSAIVFAKPRLAGLLTGRKFLAYQRAEDQNDLFNYFRSMNVSYILENDQFPSDRAYLNPVLNAASDTQLVYSIGPYHLYRYSAGLDALQRSRSNHVGDR